MLRDEVVAAKPYVLNEMTEKLKDLTPKQLKMVDDVMNAMLNNFDCLEKTADEFIDEY